ncbi:hypothetical protein [Candidatus Poriferisocius sp.]|uniref:hypothetical protein n=1 Tax=Candidatus Poriferisocius sp. TaxID=3101276 RepID=UPI003B0284AA
MGPDLLARFITETTTAPFISANLDFSAEPTLAALAEQGRIAPSVVVERRPLLLAGAATVLLGLLLTASAYLLLLRRQRRQQLTI